MPVSLAYWGIPVIGALLLLVYLARMYVKVRGSRVIICPETHAAAGVAVDAWHVIAPGLSRTPELRLQSCSRWPERAGCGQECIHQIEDAPEDCLFKNLLARWYVGKTCAICHEPFGGIHWADHRPALMSTDGQIKEWREVPPEQVFKIQNTHVPVCWRCFLMRTFYREHSDLIVDRSRVWPRML